MADSSEKVVTVLSLYRDFLDAWFTGVIDHRVSLKQRRKMCKQFGARYADDDHGDDDDLLYFTECSVSRSNVNNVLIMLGDSTQTAAKLSVKTKSRPSTLRPPSRKSGPTS